MSVAGIGWTLGLWRRLAPPHREDRGNVGESYLSQHASLVRHQHWDRHETQHAVCHATEYELAQARMTVAAHHN